MTKQNYKNEPGTLIKGPDGSVYFISDKQLEAHKVNDEIAKLVSSKNVFDSQILGVEDSPRDVGLSNDDEPTRIGIIDLSVLQKRS